MFYSISSSAAFMPLEGDFTPYNDTYGNIDCYSSEATSCSGWIGPLERTLEDDGYLTPDAFGMYTSFLSDSNNVYKLVVNYNEYILQSGRYVSLIMAAASDVFYVSVYGRCDGPCDPRAYISWTLTPQAVPIPAAAFMFAPALLGFLGLRRKKRYA